jgi:hypothetical protein
MRRGAGLESSRASWWSSAATAICSALSSLTTSALDRPDWVPQGVKAARLWADPSAEMTSWAWRARSTRCTSLLTASVDPPASASANTIRSHVESRPLGRAPAEPSRPASGGRMRSLSAPPQLQSAPRTASLRVPQNGDAFGVQPEEVGPRSVDSREPSAQAVLDQVAGATFAHQVASADPLQFTSAKAAVVPCGRPLSLLHGARALGTETLRALLRRL